MKTARIPAEEEATDLQPGKPGEQRHRPKGRPEKRKRKERKKIQRMEPLLRVLTTTSNPAKPQHEGT